jgi:L-lactate dehydrogenase complex protein LldE
VATEDARAPVQLFVSCMVDLFEPDTGRAAVAVLERRGMEVEVPPGQTCCGQFAYNAGHWDEAAAMAENFLESFGAGTGPVVALSGSCAAMVLHEYPRLLVWDAEHRHLGEAARQRLEERHGSVAARLVELSQWLATRRAWLSEPSSRDRLRVAFHHSCHMRRMLGVVQEPLLVLDAIGCETIPLADAEQCCGFGGTYAMTEPAVSTALADAKLEALAGARGDGATALASCDWGCLLHLGGRLRRCDDDFPVLHLAELVDLADRGRLTPEAIRAAHREEM